MAQTQTLNINPLTVEFWQSVLKDNGQLLTLGVIAILLMLIIPLPVAILDFLMISNIILSLLIMITVINTKNTIEFSVFPTVLLFTTVLRLAINVSSTRLILTQGSAFQGQVVTAFANFVIGGNYVVGVIIFIVITAVLFMVITKGSTRVSEVSARFQLDAMPQKQLAIDTELSQGLISEQQAVKKREIVQAEANFYGNMDGASKFVSGDVKVGILITLVNIIGGLIIGVGIKGEDLSAALSNYVMFSIGDGLVAQLPSLLISTAAGVIVTKSVSEDGLASDMRTQLFSDSRAFYISSGFVFLMSFVPRFPMFIFWIVSALLAYFGYAVSNIQKEKKLKDDLEQEKGEIQEEDLSTPEKMVDLVQVDPLEIELGYSLIPLVDKNSGGDLLERIKKTRRQIVLEYGLIVPQVRITDNMELEPDQYMIKLSGDVVGGAVLRMDRLLALNTTGVENGLQGEATIEPVFGLPAKWVTSDQKDHAEKSGYTVFDGPTIVATHLNEIIKKHAGSIMGRKEVKNLLDSVGKRNAVIIEELAKLSVKTGDVQKVLQELLAEGISIRSIDAILEIICDYYPATGSKDQLIELVRAGLKRQISSKVSDPGKNIHTVVLSSELEGELTNLISETDKGYALSLSPEALQGLLENTKHALDGIKGKGYQEILTTDPLLRKPLKRLLSRNFPALQVISYNEIAEGYALDAVETV